MSRRLTDGATVRFVRDCTGADAGFPIAAGTIGEVRAISPDTGRVVVAVPVTATGRAPSGRTTLAVTVERRLLRVTAPAPVSPFVTFQPRGARS